MWFTEAFGDRVGRVEVGAGPPRADLAVGLRAPGTPDPNGRNDTAVAKTRVTGR
ncbi:hypothetical protein ACTVZO_21130 [Streptomyces sp. IBSNAI002]|uniref:hypothetical protein n=1 Tax=Streptomyces sp. IBSNAI002 TaxID=3457500 RepID=UPI003FD535A9